MTAGPQNFGERFRRSWSAETATTWTAENPARGQCSVTAIVVQGMFGGDILKADAAGAPHFYNRIGGVRHDLTAAQFPRPIEYQDLPSDAEEALKDTSPGQVAALRRAVDENG